MVIGYVVGGMLSLILIGYLLIFAVWALSIIFGIMAAIAANSGQYYKYPLSITFVQLGVRAPHHRVGEQAAAQRQHDAAADRGGARR